MLNFRLGSIVRSISNSGADLESAAKAFFGSHALSPDIPRWKNISSLFNEWLIFDYRLSSDVTIATWYYLKNPDHMPDALLHELRDIIQTQTYDLFEVENIHPGEWVDVWGLSSGKKYHVLERTFSRELQGRKGCFFNRVARVHGDYYFIGSNPFLFPITHTDRSRAFFGNSKNKPLSPKDALPFLFEKNDTKQSGLAVSLTRDAIRSKRRKLEKKFGEFIRDYQPDVTFSTLVNFVYNESYEDHFADFYKDITALGIPERMIVDNLPFFQDLWNFFPHKKLGGTCPAQRYRETYG